MLHIREHGGLAGRVVLLDAIRAVAVISMVIGHVANYSFLWRTSHFAYYVWDGAQLFMVVSGIVVGMSQRRLVHRHGLRASASKLAKRAGLLYLIQLALVGIALVTTFVAPGEWTAVLRPAGIDTWQQALGWSLLLNTNPIYVNFLSTYVILLLAAIPAVYLLKRHHLGVVVVATAAIYAAGILLPQLFTLHNGPTDLGTFNNATWFVLFMTGMIVGWKWQDWRVTERLMSRRVSILAFGGWFLLLGLVIVDATAPAALGPVNWFFDKDQMAPGRLLSAWVFFVVIYWVATEIERQPWGDRIVHPAAVLGGRALDSIVILTLAAILLPPLLQQASSGRVAQLLSLLVLGICWAWAYARRW